FTLFDVTTYHTTFMKRDLELLLKMEADRFSKLEYDEGAFQAEAGAIMGEYRNSISPTSTLRDALLAKAFSVHPYGHPILGLPEDIAEMPRHYQYSKQFFRQFYRPGSTTIVLAGDVNPERALRLIRKHWGSWQQRAENPPPVPKEPPPAGPAHVHVPWP